ncbi:hypothetical protein [Bradymonas sediminis]|uniref:Uncharacterized protein n=1 Tax=Bradymonas sediminis TaxID=1548548 RepID=A0A2Z4FMW6_9DELT|nr:hypothetical protein [Bradymonas sediminis]AWV90018.1 hypothetical protein DN745_11980 [Bradymonas sediminis]TDP76026.1 hypothetical protein DFR33_103376 [Bradymonas sediminis]
MSNKSGRSSDIISLPQSGSALGDIGESFSPDIFTGSGNFSVPISVPGERNGFQHFLVAVELVWEDRADAEGESIDSFSSYRQGFEVIDQISKGKLTTEYAYHRRRA